MIDILPVNTHMNFNQQYYQLQISQSVNELVNQSMN